MPLPLDTRLGIYQVVRPLGAGGMGEVYLARDTRLQRDVAIKVLPAALASDQEWHSRFVREAQLLASLNHPSIATIHGLEETPDGSRYLVMERVEGETLASKLARGALAVAEALDLSGQIALALEAAHARGVVHRDLKPGNVMVTPGSTIKLLDFGLASSAGAGVGSDGTSRVAVVATQSAAKPDASTTMGTPGYMSPEQVRGETQDRRTDIFSFGCVLYECLSGRRAFSGKTAAEAMGAVLFASADLGALPGGTPGGIRTLLERCLEKDPAKRLRDIGDARMEIETAKGTRATRTVPTIASALHNLPKPRTTFIGRDKELADCVRFLSENRVLTLTGVGGSGKTRLALKIAESRVAEHRDGVWFVDFAPIQDADRVPVAVATVLGVKEEPGGTLIEGLSAHLSTKDALLVLDNCEHVLAASTTLAETLLASSPELRVLATSREGLGLDGERLFAVRSLGVPQTADWHDLHALESSDAIRLFLDRAHAAEPNFKLNASNGPIVAEICRRLDGIPLAIELAAARVKILSVDQIRAKLDDRFRLLTGGSKTALPRHQTLRATVQWSYDQLTEDEQEMLKRLSVFAGGWTLEGATAVSSDDDDEFEVLDHLTRLVDKSLVVVEREGGGEPRYRMLETVRQYAEERLSESGHGELARSKHVEFYLGLAVVGEPKLLGPEMGEWLARFDAELENLLSGIEWCKRNPEGAAQQGVLARALRNYWEPRGLLELGIRVTRDAIDRGPAGVPPLVRVRLFGSLSSLLQRRGDAQESLRIGHDAMALAREAGDQAYIASAHRTIGTGYLLLGKLAEARPQMEEAIRILRGLNNPDNTLRLAAAIGSLGEVLRSGGESVAAKACYEESVALSRKIGDLDGVALNLINLAMVEIDAGDLSGAGRHLREATQITVKVTGKYVGAFCVSIGGTLAGKRGDYVRAARYHGAAAESRERMGVAVDPVDQQFLTPHLAQLREEMGAAAFAEAERVGRALSHESALADTRAWLESLSM